MCVYLSTLFISILFYDCLWFFVVVAPLCVMCCKHGSTKHILFRASSAVVIFMLWMRKTSNECAHWIEEHVLHSYNYWRFHKNNEKKRRQQMAIFSKRKIDRERGREACTYHTIESHLANVWKHSKCFGLLSIVIYSHRLHHFRNLLSEFHELEAQ